MLTEEGETEELEFNIEVREGDGLFTTLFYIFLDAIKSCNLKGTITNGVVLIETYADDPVVLARDKNSRH